jgi:hypothetical protein
MEDGLGLVFEQQGNTGAAAYNQPMLQVGNTSADRIAGVLQGQVMAEREQKKLDDKAAAKKKEAAAEAMRPKSQRGWINDTPYFGDKLNKLKDDFTGLMNRGISPDDYGNAEARAYQDALDNYNNEIAVSQQNEASYPKVLEEVELNPEKYDVEKSKANLEAWRTTPQADRFNKPITSALVLKEKPFDAWAPVETLKIADYTGEYGTKNADGSGGSGTYLNKANLKKDVEAAAINPLNDEHFKKGVDKGLWKDRKDYAKQLYEKAKLKYTASSQTVAAALATPTESDYLQSGNIEDLKKVYQLGTAPANIHSAAGSGQTHPMTLSNTINVGAINAVVPKAAAVNAKDGKPLEGEGAINIISGNMSTPMVLKGTNKLIAFPKNKDGVYTYKIYDKATKTMKPFTGATQKDVEKQLVAAGYGEYKPMVLATYKNSLGSEQTAWVPAEALPATTETKGLQGFAAARVLLNRIASEENGTTTQAATGASQVWQAKYDY